MEQSLSSLTFKRSIPEAISEAKIQEKLLVVYISGENALSNNMENSTWLDPKVSESISKYCILLHVAEGSVDADNFSMIYPQEPSPCITAVGYNGVLIWQHGGFIDAENLASSLEKAWLSLHIQQTTASVMAAALAGRTSESTSAQASPEASNEQCRASSAVPLPSNGNNQSPELAASAIIKEEKLDGESVKTDSENVIKEESTSSTEPLNESGSSLLVETSYSGHENPNSDMENERASSEAKAKHLLEIAEGSNTTRGSRDPIVPESKIASVDEITESRSTETPSGSIKSTDVHLNIRLPDGISLQEKFPVTSTLRSVKDYVDENRANDNSAYDFAIPYPRKVFNDQDLNKSLEVLELLGRQALIVVPRGRGNTSRGQVPLSYSQPDSSRADLSNSSEGYFAFARRVLSYFNPFSYLGGGGSGASSSSGQDSNTGRREYRPNINSRDDTEAQERPYSQDSVSRETIRSRRPTTSQFGSNIHTLKHDDDDDSRSRDRNSFWNGNSTQYGGGDNNESR